MRKRGGIVVLAGCLVGCCLGHRGPLIVAQDVLRPKTERSAIHVGTPPDVVAKMLEVAQVTKDDLVYDLGCGDGRIVVAAAIRFGCRAVGYDIDAESVRLSKENVRRHGLEKLVRIEHRDIFTLDLRPASVITLYLLPEMNIRLVPQLEKMKPGSRIVAHDFGIDGVQHDRHITMTSQENQVPRDIYLYTLPLKVAPAAR